MSRYTEVSLGPSEGQLSDLAEGNAVHLAPSHMKGDVTFHLTKTQIAGIQKAHAAGRGYKLKLSPAQVKHMAQHGSGRFSDLLSKAKDLAKPALRKGLDFALTKGKDFAQDKIEKLAGIHDEQKGQGWLGDLGRKLGHGAVDLAANALGGNILGDIGDLIGLGVSPVEHRHLKAMHKMHGAGWLGDLAKKIAHGGVDFVADKLGGSVREGARPATAAQIRQLRAMEAQHGAGWLSSTLRSIAHGGVDLAANALGGAVGAMQVQPKMIPNPHYNPNEELRAALLQKKVPIKSGSGLYLP